MRTNLSVHGNNVALYGVMIAVCLALIAKVYAPQEYIDWVLDLGPLFGSIFMGLLLYVPIKLLSILTTAKCPNCGKRSLTTFGTLKDGSVSHSCSKCGSYYKDGVEIEKPEITAKNGGEL